MDARADAGSGMRVCERGWQAWLGAAEAASEAPFITLPRLQTSHAMQKESRCFFVVYFLFANCCLSCIGPCIAVLHR